MTAALTGLLLSLAILSGLAHANGRYFYCEAMGLLESDPCAAAAAERLSAERSKEPGAVELSAEARQGHRDCCEVVTLPPMPAASRVNAAAPAVPPPALAAIPSPSCVLPLRAPMPQATSHRSAERWRVPPASARVLRAQLMVFLT